MATPTVAELYTNLRDIVRILDAHLADGVAFVANGVTAKGNIRDDASFGDAQLSAFRIFRQGLAANMSLGPTLLDPWLLELAHCDDSGANKDPWPERSARAILDRWSRYLIDEDEKVTSNGITYGAITKAGTNTGNGIMLRLTVDEDGQAIQSGRAESVEAICIQDRNSGARENEEVFEIRGESLPEDLLEEGGTGLTVPITALSASATRRIFQNPSFGDDAAAAPATVLTGWTVSTIGNIDIVTTPTFRTHKGEGTEQAIKIKSVTNIKQTFEERNISFTPGVPMLVQVAYNTNGAVSAGSGKTLKVTFGAVSISSADLSGVAANWKILQIAIGANSWLKAFNKNDGELKIETVGFGASDSVIVDDVVVGPFTRYSGSVGRGGEYYAITGDAPLGASGVPFLRDDKHTWTTTGGVTAKMQRHIVRAYPGQYLPTSGTTLIAEP